PNATKYVRLPGSLQRDRIYAMNARSDGHTSKGSRCARRRRRWGHIDGGIKAGPRDSNGRLCRPELSFAGENILIGDVHLLFQRVEFAVLIDFPPFVANDAVGWLSFLPSRGRRFAIPDRCGNRWTLIFRSHHATGRDQQEYTKSKSGKM